MFSRFRNVVANVMGGIAAIPHPTEEAKDSSSLELKYRYSRPEFLQLTEDEVQVSADHGTRPILVPRDISRLKWNTGYAEVINAGKSEKNEDQAGHDILHIKKQLSPQTEAETASIHSPFISPYPGPGETETLQTQSDIADEETIPTPYFCVFDGHAGTGAAVMAVNLLHRHIQEKLSAVKPLIMAKYSGDSNQTLKEYSFGSASKDITLDNLVIGAIEAAFLDMDAQIARERTTFKITGGCTALVAIFFLGKLYLANAGDSRAVICQDNHVIPMSNDFTPITERKRLQYLAYLQPELLANEFTHLEFPRRIHKRDVGKKMLYRDAEMTGWAYKTIIEDDLKFPLIFGEGKRSRILGTIGVTRGLGDHDLQVYDTDIHVKPFLSPMPEVQIFDFSKYELTANDVLVMACDGLWDVISNEEAAEIVQKALSQSSPADVSRYTSAAQELVVSARGMPKGRSWRIKEDCPASGDDISVFVIPLLNYKTEETTRLEHIARTMPQRTKDKNSNGTNAKHSPLPEARSAKGVIPNGPIPVATEAYSDTTVGAEARQINGSMFYTTLTDPQTLLAEVSSEKVGKS